MCLYRSYDIGHEVVLGIRGEVARNCFFVKSIVRATLTTL
jgi:hypothetical protein